MKKFLVKIMYFVMTLGVLVGIFWLGTKWADWLAPEKLSIPFPMWKGGLVWGSFSMQSGIRIFIGSLLAVSFIFIPFYIKIFATANFLITEVKEGTAKAIVGFGGAYEKLLWQYREHEMDTAGNITTSTEAKRGFWNGFNSFLGLGGIRFIGIPFLHKIYTYNFRFESIRQFKEEDSHEMDGIFVKQHEEKLDYILLKPDVYYTHLSSAEDSNRIPIDVDYTIKARIINPYKALFGIQEWLEAVWVEVNDAMRRYIGGSSWDSLQSLPDKFWTGLVDVEAIKRSYGVEVLDLNVLRFRLAGSMKDEYERQATLDYQTEKEAERITKMAEADQKAIKVVYDEIESHEDGVSIRMIQALEKTDSNIFLSTDGQDLLKALIKKGEKTDD